MQTEDKTPLTLTVAERRDLIITAREVIKYKLQHVIPQYGVTPQNLYPWLKDPTKTTMSEAKQLTVVQLYGFLPDGSMSPEVLHAWSLSGPDSIQHAEKMLRHERVMEDVRITPAYTSVHARRRDPNEFVRGFVGAYVTWSGSIPAELSPKKAGAPTTAPKRLIITVQHSYWGAEDFIAWLAQLTESISGKRPTINEDLEIYDSAATSVWRWALKPRMATGERATMPPNKGPLPFDQDIVGTPSAPAAESALSVLQDIAPRFQILAEAHSKAKGNSTLNRHDGALLRRAKNVLNASTQVTS